jgi:hypothetical protein
MPRLPSSDILLQQGVQFKEATWTSTLNNDKPQNLLIVNHH